MNPTESRDVHGILLFDKPQGLSSNRALQRVRHLYGADKAGHTGSLDPLATGLLPLCFGEATKIAGLLLGSRKAYETEARLGVTTETDDAEGKVLKTRTVPAIDDATIAAALAKLTGRIAQMPPAYWWVVGAGAALTLARFSEAFLVLRAQQAGVALALTPVVMVLMNVVYSLLAYPFGKLADSMSHRMLLALGIMPLIAADVLLAHAGHRGWLWAGLVCWGVHMAATQGLLAAMVADTAPENLRGTAFGLFNLASGIAMLAASVVAGVLWDHFGSSVTFLAGAVFAALSLLLLTRRFPAD